MKVLVIILGMLMSVNGFAYLIVHGQSGLYYVYCKDNANSVGTTSTYEEAQALGESACDQNTAVSDDNIDKFEIRHKR